MRVIPYRPDLGRRLGVTCAIYYRQMLYYDTKHGGCWFEKSKAEIEYETAFTRDQQETSRNKLKEMGLLIWRSRPGRPDEYRVLKVI